MTTNDAFNRQMRDVAAQFMSWARGFEAEAEFVADDAAGYWKLAAMPRLANACPFEFAVHPEGRVDYFIGGENYEERPLQAPESLLPLAGAIAAGSVIRREIVSTNTRLLFSTETIVTRADGTQWRDGHKGPFALPGNAASDLPVVYRDHSFAPYKR